jgi:hypothetical protein
MGVVEPNVWIHTANDESSLRRERNEVRLYSDMSTNPIEFCRYYVVLQSRTNVIVVL